MPEPLPTQTEALGLHQRLLAGDTVATKQLAEAYLQPLIDHLAQTQPRALEDDDCATAAADALLSLMKNPASYDPRRKELFPYLCMSAHGDLLNLKKREARHSRKRDLSQCVEELPDAGNYLGREDDLSESVVAAVLASATPEERRVLELMLDGQRDTAVFAEALGLADRPRAEQEQEVKRMKDRIKARLKRSRRQT